MLHDIFKLSGRVHIDVLKSNVKIDEIDLENIILDNGKQKVIESLNTGSLDQIFRMAVGDDGASITDLFQPKVPTVTMTELYHEVYRRDISSSIPGVKQVEFVASFNSTFVPDSSFQNASKRFINEAALVMGDGVLGGGDIVAPNIVDADESLFSIRTFKSIPFEQGDDITITIRWTIFIQ